jgi:hypothetical protein
MCICTASENAKMGDRGFTTIECFEWGLSHYSGGRGEVENV